MKHVKVEKIKNEFGILHGKSGYYYIPHHVDHLGKINHKLHISAIIEDDDADFDIAFHILNEEEFSDSIPELLQNAEGDKEQNVKAMQTIHASKKPKYTMNIEKTQTLFILFDNSYSVWSDKTIQSTIQEE